MNKTINIGEGRNNVEIHQTIAKPDTGPSVGWCQSYYWLWMGSGCIHHTGYRSSDVYRKEVCGQMGIQIDVT